MLLRCTPIGSCLLLLALVRCLPLQRLLGLPMPRKGLADDEREQNGGIAAHLDWLRIRPNLAPGDRLIWPRACKQEGRRATAACMLDCHLGAHEGGMWVNPSRQQHAGCGRGELQRPWPHTTAPLSLPSNSCAVLTNTAKSAPFFIRLALQM